MNGLLRQYVKEIIQEAIRTKKGVKGKFGPKFKFEAFKRLPNYNDMLDYASEFLDELGGGKAVGSSRRAFIFSGSKVLKIAKNDAGIAQNEAEAIIYNSALQASEVSVLTKVYAYDSNFNWIIVDMAKVESADQATVDKFKSLSGISWPMFQSLINGDRQVENVKLSPKGKKFVSTMLSLIDSAGLLKGDILKLEHWGVVGGDRLVLIDYGFTVEVREREYEPSEKDGRKGWKVRDKDMEAALAILDKLEKEKKPASGPEDLTLPDRTKTL